MAKNPIAYVKHDGPVYVGSKFYEAGKPFVTDAEPGDGWEKLDKDEKAAMDASDPTQHLDVPLETMSVAALQALAATKKVNPDGLNKKDLITAIKAADEPAL